MPRPTPTIERQPWDHFANSAADAYNFSAFPQTAAGFANLPTVSFITPNDQDNMTPTSDSGGGIPEGDAWVQANLSAYAAWAQANNSLLIITFDENNTNPAVTYPDHIATIVVGAGVPAGVTNDSQANHLFSAQHDRKPLRPDADRRERRRAGARLLFRDACDCAHPRSPTSFSGISDPNNTPPQNALAVGPQSHFHGRDPRLRWSPTSTATRLCDDWAPSMFSGSSSRPLGSPTLDNTLLDARAAYDSSTGRYVIIANNFQPGGGNFGTNIDIAVSKDSNPADGWYLASIDTSNGFTTQSDMPYLSVSNGEYLSNTPEYLDAGGGLSARPNSSSAKTAS